MSFTTYYTVLKFLRSGRINFKRILCSPLTPIISFVNFILRNPLARYLHPTTRWKLWNGTTRRSKVLVCNAIDAARWCPRPKSSIIAFPVSTVKCAEDTRRTNLSMSGTAGPSHQAKMSATSARTARDIVTRICFDMSRSTTVCPMHLQRPFGKTPGSSMPKTPRRKKLFVKR